MPATGKPGTIKGENPLQNYNVKKIIQFNVLIVCVLTCIYTYPVGIVCIYGLSFAKSTLKRRYGFNGRIF